VRTGDHRAGQRGPGLSRRPFRGGDRLGPRRPARSGGAPAPGRARERAARRALYRVPDAHRAAAGADPRARVGAGQGHAGRRRLRGAGLNLALSEEQRLLREAARGTLSRVPTVAAARAALDGEPTPDLWPAAREAGWPGLLIAEQRGGAGLGAFDAMLVMEE